MPLNLFVILRLIGSMKLALPGQKTSHFAKFAILTLAIPPLALPTYLSVKLALSINKIKYSKKF